MTMFCVCSVCDATAAAKILSRASSSSFSSFSAAATHIGTGRLESERKGRIFPAGGRYHIKARERERRGNGNRWERERPRWRPRGRKKPIGMVLLPVPGIDPRGLLGVVIDEVDLPVVVPPDVPSLRQWDTLRRGLWWIRGHPPALGVGHGLLDRRLLSYYVVVLMHTVPFFTFFVFVSVIIARLLCSIRSLFMLRRTQLHCGLGAVFAASATSADGRSCGDLYTACV